MFFKFFLALFFLQVILVNAHSLRFFKRQTDICKLVYCQNGELFLFSFNSFMVNLKIYFKIKGGTCLQSNNLAMCKCVTGFYGMWCQFRRPSFSSTTTTSIQSLCSLIKCQNGK